VKHPLNVVLMNWYGNGEHHVGWHSDSEDDLVDGAAIASLSLGETRTFQLRHRSDSEMGRVQQELCAKAKQGMRLNRSVNVRDFSLTRDIVVVLLNRRSGVNSRRKDDSKGEGRHRSRT